MGSESSFRISASGAVTWTRLAPDASADAVAVTPGGAGACAGAVAVKPDLATVVNVETSGAAVDAEPPGLVAPAVAPVFVSISELAVAVEEISGFFSIFLDAWVFWSMRVTSDGALAVRCFFSILPEPGRSICQVPLRWQPA